MHDRNMFHSGASSSHMAQLKGAELVKSISLGGRHMTCTMESQR